MSHFPTPRPVLSPEQRASQVQSALTMKATNMMSGRKRTKKPRKTKGKTSMICGWRCSHPERYTSTR